MMDKSSPIIVLNLLQFHCFSLLLFAFCAYKHWTWTSLLTMSTDIHKKLWIWCNRFSTVLHQNYFKNWSQQSNFLYWDNTQFVIIKIHKNFGACSTETKHSITKRHRALSYLNVIYAVLISVLKHKRNVHFYHTKPSSATKPSALCLRASPN